MNNAATRLWWRWREAAPDVARFVCPSYIVAELAGRHFILIHCSNRNTFYVVKYWEPRLRNGVGLPSLTSLKSGSSGTNPFKLGAVCHNHTSVSILWLT